MLRDVLMKKYLSTFLTHGYGQGSLVFLIYTQGTVLVRQKRTLNTQVFMGAIILALKMLALIIKSSTTMEFIFLSNTKITLELRLHILC